MQQFNFNLCDLRYLLWENEHFPTALNGEWMVNEWRMNGEWNTVNKDRLDLCSSLHFLFCLVLRGYRHFSRKFNTVLQKWIQMKKLHSMKSVG